MHLSEATIAATLLWLTPWLPLSAQEIVGAFYPSPPAIVAAPGQVFRLLVHGLKARGGAASSLPLPTTLSGVSVALLQGTQPIPLPIFSIGRFEPCSGSSDAPCADLSSITVQIPMELAYNPPGSTGPPIIGFLSVSEGGVTGVAVRISPWPDNIQVLVILHTNGRPVDALSPARGGEILIMFALGLGRTDPPVATGTPAPSPAPMARRSFIHFDFRPNAPPMRPYLGSAPPIVRSPLFAGLVPGFVGLYQINFTVPEVPPGTLPCVPAQFPLPSDLFTVFSNLTVTLFGEVSFDGARICVQP